MRYWWNMATMVVLLVLVACGNTNEIVVSFDTNGGTEIASVYLTDGRLTLPEEPLMEGHTFDGWFLDEDFLSDFSVEDDIIDDLTLHAKWVVNEYVITFDTSGGNAIPSETVAYGDVVSFPTPIRDGYAFVGWGDGSETAALSWTTMQARDVTLVAIWEAITSNQVELVIGVLLPLSGEFAEDGIAAYNGIQMAVATINASGGVNDYTFRVAAFNTAGDVGTISSLYVQLMEETNLIAIIGGLAPGEAMAIRTLAIQDNVPLITLDALDPDVTQGTTLVHRITLTEAQRHEMALAYILEGLEAEHIAILFELDDPDSYAMKEAFRTYLIEQGILNTSYNLSEDPYWYSSYISSIRFRSCDIIIAPAAQGYASDFMAQASEEGLDIPFVAVDSWNYDISPYDLARMLEEYHPADETAVVQAFTEEYLELHEELPNRHAALGYDAVMVIASAVADWHSGAFTSDLIHDVMLDQSISGLLGFTESGDAIKRLLVVEYQEGTPAIVTTFE